MRRKTTQMSFYAINKRYLTWENMNVTNKGKPYERNRISTYSSTKQTYKDQSYQSMNR